MKVLVVGGGGFIGSSVAKQLLLENIETVILDNFSSQFQDRSVKDAETVEADFSNKDTLVSVMKGITHVWHGAYPHNIDSRVDDVSTVWKNIKATIQLAKIAMQNKVESIVYASSRSVYGNAQYNPVDEKHPIDPVTMYGLCKSVCERYLADYLSNTQTRLCILRGFLVYGPGDKQSCVVKFAETMLRGKRPTIYGDGSATRDFIHVSDVGRATVLALRLQATGIFNVASGEETSLLSLIDLLRSTIGLKDVQPVFDQKDAWNVNDRFYASIAKASTALGFMPQVTLADGLRDTVEFLKRQHTTLQSN